jgi:glycosyltransferase involved in cell wall biosynthesis
VRIAHVSDVYLPRLGGIELHVRDLAAHQLAAGHDVTVVTPQVRGEAALQAPDDPPVIHVPSAGPAPLGLGCVHRGRRVLLTGDFDVVHAHVSVVSPFTAMLASAAADRGVPTLVTLHSLLAAAGPAHRALDGVTRWTRRPLVWSAVSEAAAAPLRRALGPSRPVTVLPNAVDVDAWRVPPLPRDPSELVVVAVMRMAARKRPLALARMLRALRESVPPAVGLRAVLVGDGPQRADLERYLRRHRMQGWVEVPGRYPRERIRDLYRSADVFVAPATLESFGIAALEARCAGVPVVAHARSGVAGFVTDGLDGLLARSDAEMVGALAALAVSPRLRNRLAERARAVRPDLGWDAALLRTDRVYGAAAAAAGARTAVSSRPPVAVVTSRGGVRALPRG